MKERLVSYEVSKLAKEKGFDIETINWFYDFTEYSYSVYKYNSYTEDKVTINTPEQKCVETNSKHFNNVKNEYARPTQSLLQKWLRDVHDIDVRVYRDYQFMIKKKSLDSQYYDAAIYNTYEDALEQGLLEGLNLIK